ncbi:hypothetical protein B0T26DRAFT_867407 [Lasiosphaeria miniovina]|uniref:Deubiquitination-protection protein dph1 n=1 Tax=Lasiosphaeria miniovina TaxID=1954250 RepID=A0AA40EDF5_9PEZI|nr:uncharacterized protein B0T26DRAFT_867407 [Lasiosphaeria miniovina]KAK0734302.1 hypothetical protein B0T26DRAFT_867407 [Lasiosphaeria miniovina]
MADNSEPAAEAQLTFKVKSSSDTTHTITMADTATVLDLKTKLAGSDFEDVPVERQRLIYSGRVMKNDDALSVYKIKNHNTIHMVKSAASNPTPANTGSSSAPTPQAVPIMAAGTSANNLLAGLTGARYAGHASLPSRDLFGADGGMGAPPSEDQMADMLANPAVAQTMNEALNNPIFVDHMIQSNPMLANMPNAREMLQSPYFRSMMTNPDAIRMAARMRRMMSGGEASAFPAPGVTDTTPDAEGTAASGGDNNIPAMPQMPFLFPGMFGAPGAPGAPGPASSGASRPGNPFANLWGAAAPQTSATTGAAAPAASESRDAPAPAGNAGASQQLPNPFTALFGAAPGRGGNSFGGGNNAANPFGLPAISPEAMQQAMQMWGMGGMEGLTSPAAAAPQDTRPPEERYAEQLRQLNDMGFFDFDRNIAALRRSGGSVQGAIEHLLGGS